VRLRNMNFVQILMQKDHEKIKAFHERLQEKVRKKAAFQANMVEEKSWEDKYQTRLETLSAQRQKKAQWLFRIENERTLYEKLLAELQDSSRELEKLFLEKEKEKQRSRVERIGTPLVPGGSFKKQKGLLPWPVEGKVLREFGKQMDPKYNTLIVNDGIDIKVVPEQEIRAVFDGSVVYAGWFRGYGQLLIVDHGDDYCSVIAHADRLIKGTGDRVDVGEVLGYAGETGSLMGPAIHFEIRHNGQPVDPLSWIKAR
jgi:septal ring factor EnvC (AmiA/AmiB activator)